MTLVNNLSKQGLSTTGIVYSTGVYTLTIADMNAVIVAYNNATNSTYPTWDTVTDNFERLSHFVNIFTKLQNVILGNDSFNAKWTGTNPQNQTFGNRGLINSKVVSIAYPFSLGNDVDGDTDNLG